LIGVEPRCTALANFATWRTGGLDELALSAPQIVGSPVLPDLPSRLQRLNLCSDQAFKLAVVPFCDVFGDGMTRGVSLSLEQEMEGTVCPLTRRNKHGGDLILVDDT
jgi:hypothetical protein